LRPHQRPESRSGCARVDVGCSIRKDSSVPSSPGVLTPCRVISSPSVHEILMAIPLRQSSKKAGPAPSIPRDTDAFWITIYGRIEMLSLCPPDSSEPSSRNLQWASNCSLKSAHGLPARLSEPRRGSLST